jgi:hypothetical protein
MKLSILLSKILILLFISIPGQSFSSESSHSGSLLQDTIVKSKAVVQPVYKTMRLSTKKPVIDGKLDDECWETGVWAGDYHQFVPNEGAEPSDPTEMKILYDDKFIYVAFRAYDSEPEKIQIRSGARDEFVGDIMGINFDSYHDHRTGFEFSLTAWGQKIDLILFNPMNMPGLVIKMGTRAA